MLELSKNEQWCCATILNGFILWNITGDKVQKLVLPNGVRNITKKFNTSSNIILSKGDKLAVTGIHDFRLELGSNPLSLRLNSVSN